MNALHPTSYFPSSMRALPENRPLLFPLFALALLLAQWLSFAHSLDHAGPLPEHDCGLCVAAMDLDTVVPMAAMSAAMLWLDVEALPALLAISAAPAPSPLPRARAPPETVAA